MPGDASLGCFVVPARARKDLVALGAAVALLCAVTALVRGYAPQAGAADAGALEAKLAGVRDEAGSIAAGLRASRERLAVAEGEAAKAQAKVEAERILAGAKAEIEQEIMRAKEALRNQVADLAVAGASKILKREVDAKAHADLLAAIQREL